MSEKFQKKCEEFKRKLEPLSNEKRYEFLIEMGKKLPPFPKEKKTPENLVPGCQSAMYLSSHQRDGYIYFEITSDALISAGLGALLISLYSGETPETILKANPNFIREIGIHKSLSPSRSNGLANILLKIRKESLKYLFKHGP